MLLFERAHSRRFLCGRLWREIFKYIVKRPAQLAPQFEFDIVFVASIDQRYTCLVAPSRRHDAGGRLLADVANGDG